MKLEITQREREGIQLFDLKGRIVAGDEVSMFRETVEALGEEQQSRVILNLREVDVVDSTGLGAMVMWCTRIRKSGGAARLVHLNRRHMELLIMTKLDTIFEAFDDETEAVNSFFPERAIRKFDILSFVRTLKEQQ